MLQETLGAYRENFAYLSYASGWAARRGKFRLDLGEPETRQRIKKTPSSAAVIGGRSPESKHSELGINATQHDPRFAEPLVLHTSPAPQGNSAI
jgi:hypothetical protein